MSKHTKLDWADATWNVVTGCSKVSLGCRNCYAERDWERLSKSPAYAGRAFTDVREHPERLRHPLEWRRGRLVFVNSMSDLFHEAVSDDFLVQVFATMAACPQHVFQVLTKRPERMQALLGSEEFFYRVLEEALNTHGVCMVADDWPLANVWLGVSAENQEAANARIPVLLKTPAALHWVSAGPLLGAIDFTDIRISEGVHLNAYTGKTFEWLAGGRCSLAASGKSSGASEYSTLRWVVVEGESGGTARPMHPNWARWIQAMCYANGVPFMFKQWGEWVPRSACYHTFLDGKSCADMDPEASAWPCVRLTEAGEDGRRLENAEQGDSAYMQRVGRVMAGRLLQGVVYDEYPAGHPRPGKGRG